MLWQIAGASLISKSLHSLPAILSHYEELSTARQVKLRVDPIDPAGFEVRDPLLQHPAHEVVKSSGSWNVVPSRRLFRRPPWCW